MKRPDKRTSEILQELMDSCTDGKKITVQGLTEKLSDRAFGLIIFLFGIINGIVPGVSAIFSIPILIMAMHMLIGSNTVWLPNFIAKKHLSENLLRKALGKTIPTLRFLEKFIRPRLAFLSGPLAERFIALVLIGLAFVVFLPIPGLNLVPSLCMCLIALGILEKDGVLIFLGVTVSIVSVWFTSFVIVKAIMGTYKYLMSLIA